MIKCPNSSHSAGLNACKSLAAVKRKERVVSPCLFITPYRIHYFFEKQACNSWTENLDGNNRVNMPELLHYTYIS